MTRGGPNGKDIREGGLMAKRPMLMMTTGDLAGRRFEVPQSGGLRVGRSSSNDVHLPDEELSRNHCIFDCDGEDAIRVTDLASANGTFVNGKQLGSEPRVLKVGDVIDIGATQLKVVGEEPEPPTVAAPRGGQVDLGLGAQPASQSIASDAQSARSGQEGVRKKAVNMIVAGVVGALVVAIALMMFAPSTMSFSPSGKASRREPAKGDVAKGAADSAVVSLTYERIAADASHIFRYFASVDETGLLSVSYGDVPSENRRMESSGQLSDLAKAELARLFDSQEWAGLSGAYTGPSAESENALRSWRIRLVRGGAVKDVAINNTQEPEAFRIIRERLETLVNNELGVQSIQRTREELVRSSEHSEEVGDAKWEERDVEYGNLSECIRCYKSAKNDLATVTSSSEAVSRIQRKLERAEAELKRRYEEVRFEAERARQIGDWERARDEFRKLCEMIPDRGDSRHAEANANMVDVEGRIESARKGGRK